jgi:hypothetical protein
VRIPNRGNPFGDPCCIEAGSKMMLFDPIHGIRDLEKCLHYTRSSPCANRVSVVYIPACCQTADPRRGIKCGAFIIRCLKAGTACYSVSLKSERRTLVSTPLCKPVALKTIEKYAKLLQVLKAPDRLSG